MPRDVGYFARKLRRAILPSQQQLVEVPDQESNAPREQEIPPVVYHTAPDRLVHSGHWKSIQQLRGLNPDLSFRWFDDNDVNGYMETNWGSHPIYGVFQRCLFGQMKSDIFRYCLIYDKGGYWMDSNKGCTKALTSFHSRKATGLITYEENPSLIVAEPQVAPQIAEPTRMVAQWAFAFIPRHPFLKDLIDEIVRCAEHFAGRSYQIPKAAVLTFTGPGQFTRVFRQFVQTRGLNGIEEAGIDFQGNWIFRVRGSLNRKNLTQHYASARNQAILVA